MASGCDFDAVPQQSAEPSCLAKQSNNFQPSCSGAPAAENASEDEFSEQALQKSTNARSRKRRTWRPSELASLSILHCALGNKWTLIAKHLRGRKDNDCKNIFHSALRSTTNETNALLRSYAQTVGPNCEDQRVRYAAYQSTARQHPSSVRPPARVLKYVATLMEEAADVAAGMIALDGKPPANPPTVHKWSPAVGARDSAVDKSTTILRAAAAASLPFAQAPTNPAGKAAPSAAATQRSSKPPVTKGMLLPESFPIASPFPVPSTGGNGEQVAGNQRLKTSIQRLTLKQGFQAMREDVSREHRGSAPEPHTVGPAAVTVSGICKAAAHTEPHARPWHLIAESQPQQKTHPSVWLLTTGTAAPESSLAHDHNGYGGIGNANPNVVEPMIVTRPDMGFSRLNQQHQEHQQQSHRLACFGNTNYAFADRKLPTAGTDDEVSGCTLTVPASHQRVPPQVEGHTWRRAQGTGLHGAGQQPSKGRQSDLLEELLGSVEVLDWGASAGHRVVQGATGGGSRGADYGGTACGKGSGGSQDALLGPFDGVVYAAAVEQHSSHRLQQPVSGGVGRELREMDQMMEYYNGGGSGGSYGVGGLPPRNASSGDAAGSSTCACSSSWCGPASSDMPTQLCTWESSHAPERLPQQHQHHRQQQRSSYAASPYPTAAGALQNRASRFSPRELHEFADAEGGDRHGRCGSMGTVAAVGPNPYPATGSRAAWPQSSAAPAGATQWSHEHDAMIPQGSDVSGVVWSGQAHCPAAADSQWVMNSALERPSHTGPHLQQSEISAKPEQQQSMMMQQQQQAPWQQQQHPQQLQQQQQQQLLHSQAWRLDVPRHHQSLRPTQQDFPAQLLLRNHSHPHQAQLIKEVREVPLDLERPAQPTQPNLHARATPSGPHGQSRCCGPLAPVWPEMQPQQQPDNNQQQRQARLEHVLAVDAPVSYSVRQRHGMGVSYCHLLAPGESIEDLAVRLLG